VEPDKLSHKGHVRISNLSSLPNELESIFKSILHRVNHVAKAHCGRPRNTLDTVHIHSTILLLGLLHELDNLVETTLNILSHMIFQVEWKVLDAVLLMVVGTVVSSTVDHMGDS